MFSNKCRCNAQARDAIKDRAKGFQIIPYKLPVLLIAALLYPAPHYRRLVGTVELRVRPARPGATVLIGWSFCRRRRPPSATLGMRGSSEVCLIYNGRTGFHDPAEAGDDDERQGRAACH